jgi:hypothetical protein
MGLSKIGTYQHSKLTWRVISGDKEKILKNCQNEPTFFCLDIILFIQIKNINIKMIHDRQAQALGWIEYSVALTREDVFSCFSNRGGRCETRRLNKFYVA